MRGLIVFLITAALCVAQPVAAQLSESAKFDLLSMQLVDQVKNEDWPAIRSTIRQLRSSGRALPASLDYFDAKAHAETGDPIEALRLLTNYINSQGREGEYYGDALSLYSTVEPAAKAAEAEARAKREAEIAAQRRAEQRRLAQDDFLAKVDIGKANLTETFVQAMELFELQEFEATARDNVKARYILGWAHYRGAGPLKANSAKAIPLLENSCFPSNPRACLSTAIVLKYGDESARNYELAMEYYKMSCQGLRVSWAVACTNVGHLYDNGRGTSVDQVQAAAYYKLGCDKGNAWGCRNLGILYGKGSGVPQSYVQAVGLYRQACEGGDMEGCRQLAWRYNNGEGIKKDRTQAAILWRKACDGGNASACVSLGYAYANGKGVKKNNTLAIRYSKMACDKGNKQGCTNLRVYRNR